MANWWHHRVVTGSRYFCYAPMFHWQRCHLIVEKKKEIVAKHSERSKRSARPSLRGVQEQSRGKSPLKLMDFSLFKTHLEYSSGTDFLAFCHTLKSVGRILLRLGKGWSILQNIQQIRANFGLVIRLQIISQVDCNVYFKKIKNFEKKVKFSDFVRKKKEFLFLTGKVASLHWFCDVIGSIVVQDR